MLVIPDFKINTKWAYGQTRILLEKPSKSVNFKVLMEKENIPFELFENDFESIICPSYPEIGAIKEKFKQIMLVMPVCRAQVRLCMRFLTMKLMLKELSYN